MPDTAHVFRVRHEQVGIRPDNLNRVSLTFAGPYASISTARAEATRRRNREDANPYFNSTITVERATGWETV